MRTTYIKIIDKLRNKRVGNTLAGGLYQRYEVIMKDNNQVIGRSGILQSKKKAEQFEKSTKQRWKRMGYSFK